MSSLQLRPGMRVAHDIYDPFGRMLLMRGGQIDAAIIAHLHAIEASAGLSVPVRVAADGRMT